MDSLQPLVSWLGAHLAMEERLVALLLLLLGGVVAHLLLDVLLRRVHRIARGSTQNWDDVVVTALEVPIRFVLWVGVLYLALDIYPVAGALQRGGASES